jgi:ATP-dependent exoDNAse (exonuclease V) beta subunit
MTVHQAKGLEFDVVVLPNLYERLGGRGVGSPALPLRDEVTEEVVGIYPYRAEGTRAFFPELQEAHRQERSARLRDEFSTLYVAMTRARYALHMVVPADGERGPGTAKSGARLLREALAPGEPADGLGRALYEMGTEDWSRGLSPQDLGEGEGTCGAPGRPAPCPALLKPSRGARRKNLARLSPSSLEGGEELDLAAHLSLEGRGDFLLRGTVTHAWCELLGWWEEGLPSDETLLLVGRKEAPGLGDSRLQGWLADFKAWTAAPEIQEHLARGFFERAHTSAHLRLERELPFLHRTEEGMLQGFVDRMVVVESEGKVVSALVQDFKTDKVGPSDSAVLEDRVAYYRPQITAYRHAVAARYGLALEDVGGELLFLRPGVVREV